MSAIAKPGLFTPNSDAGAVSEPVNLEMCKTITKEDIPSYTSNQNGPTKPRYVIRFHMLGTDNQTKEITWVYSEVATPDTARDTDYADAVAAFAASL